MTKRRKRTVTSQPGRGIGTPEAQNPLTAGGNAKSHQASLAAQSAPLATRRPEAGSPPRLRGPRMAAKP